MKINVEFLGFPMVSDVIGKKKLELNISGNTVRDVISELMRLYGKKVREAFYDEKGNFDVTVQITLNGKIFISADKHRTPLNEGDTLIFMLLLAGG
ncbi:MAG TPA: MoaD family protein [Thermodesulfobacteriota bacterium]|nr:MoaD family protein [Thermodesulfobacteriota bacterium]